MTANVWGTAASLLAARPLRVHIRPAAPGEHAPNPAAALFSANAHTTRLPAPPPSLEPRHGCIVAVLRHAPDPQKTSLEEGSQKARGSRERKEAKAGGGEEEARGESHQQQAWPGLLQHHVGLFAIYKRRDSPACSGQKWPGPFGVPMF